MKFFNGNLLTIVDGVFKKIIIKKKPKRMWNFFAFYSIIFWDAWTVPLVVEARQGKHAEHAPIFIVFFRRARKGSRARVRSIYSSGALLVLYVRLARAAFRLKRLLENKVCSAGLPNWLIGCCKILFRLVFDSLSSVCHMLYLFLIPQEVFFFVFID